MDLITQPVIETLPAEERPLALSRARGEVPIFSINPEEYAIQLDDLAKAHIKAARVHTYSLGPVLLLVRENRLWANHPEHFGSFKEWLMQPEISLSHSKATDIINWWLYFVPACETAGISKEDLMDSVDESKLRLMVAPIHRALKSGTPLPDEDIRDIVEFAKISPWNECRMYMKSLGRHETEIKEDPIISFTAIRQENKWKISGTFGEEEMGLIDTRLHPTWVSPSGQILYPKKEA